MHGCSNAALVCCSVVRHIVALHPVDRGCDYVHQKCLKCLSWCCQQCEDCINPGMSMPLTFARRQFTHVPIGRTHAARRTLPCVWVLRGSSKQGPARCSSIHVQLNNTHAQLDNTAVRNTACRHLRCTPVICAAGSRIKQATTCERLMVIPAAEKAGEPVGKYVSPLPRCSLLRSIQS